MDIPTSEHGRLIRKLDSISVLTDHDRRAVAALPFRTRSVDAGGDLISQGQAPSECCFVIDGLLCRYALTASGGRQIVSFHIPGDLADRDSLHMTHLDHAIGSVAPSRVAFIPHEAVRAVLDTRPNVAVALWRDAVLDAGVFRQWLTNLGRRTARGRTAHLLCEMFTRMSLLGLADQDHFAFPVTQAQLADALGLSAVHVNRTLQELKTEGLLSWRGSVVTIHDLEQLKMEGEFDPAYLHLKPWGAAGRAAGKPPPGTNPR